MHFDCSFQGDALPLRVLCAVDPAQAWRDLMLAGDEAALADHAGCAHPLERNLALVRALHIVAAPTLVFADGSRLTGYAGAERIESRLAIHAIGRMPKERAQ